jgi:ABC transport system ATP-binding/permease protein
VEQFKKNRYENLFYNFEKAESNSTFCTNYLIPELLNRVSICEAYLEMPEQAANLKNQLLLIRFEMKDLAKHLQISIFEKEELLTPGNFNPDLAKEVSKYLRHVRSISSKILKRSIDAKDERLMQIENRLNGHLNLVNLKEKYHNASLSDQLLNKNEAEKIIELNGRLYRKYEPVFNIPDSKYGRAHFYAPYKQLGNYLFDTFWFNMAIIWLMSILLYLTLSFNVLGKIVDYLTLREK